MRTQQETHSLCAVNEGFISGNNPSSGSLDSGFPNLESSFYPSCPVMVHHDSPISQYQPTQYGNRQGFGRQITSKEMTNLNHRGQTQAISRSLCVPACQTEHVDMIKMLPFKTTIADMTWKHLQESETRMAYQASSSWVETSAVYTSEQSVRAASGKQRIRWTYELHEQFVEAVNTLGGAMKATPKEILKLMRSEGLTIFHIKSHLQKYRTAKRAENILEGKNERTIKNERLTPYSMECGQFQISETLRLQWELQKSLHEHLEFQRKLQMRTEAYANYLETMFEQQNRGCSLVDAHHSTESNRIAEIHGMESVEDPSKLVSEMG